MHATDDKRASRLISLHACITLRHASHFDDDFSAIGAMDADHRRSFIRITDASRECLLSGRDIQDDESYTGVYIDIVTFAE